MENHTKSILMKSRSASACIKEGYGLYTRNFRKTLGSSWFTALIYSLICGALYTILTAYLPEMVTQAMVARATNSALPTGGIAIAAVIAALIIIGGLFEVASYSCIVTQLKDGFSTTKKYWKWKIPAIERQTFVRTLIAVLANLLIIAVLAAIVLIPTAILMKPSFQADSIGIKATLILVAELLAITLVTLPLTFIDMKYIMRTDTRFWRLLISDYKVGLKHFGFIIIVTLVSCIIVCVVEYILALPASIIMIAGYQANIGVFYGDPLGMPGYITYISAVVFFIAGFIQIYIRMSVWFTSYYMYGSIETQEEERRKFKETTMEQHTKSLTK